MKMIVAAISALFVFGGMGAVYAEQPAILVEDPRQINQQTRIDQGMQSNRLTRNEADCLYAQQRIADREPAMKSDGKVAVRELALVNIAKQKHGRHSTMHEQGAGTLFVQNALQKKDSLRDSRIQKLVDPYRNITRNCPR